MPKRKQIFIWILFCVLLYVAMSDAIRYLRPDGDKKNISGSGLTKMKAPPQKIIIAYNNFGGICPQLADLCYRFFSPETYPNKVVKLTNNVVGLKKEWKNFLEALPFQKVFYHKDDVERKLAPETFALPAIFLADSLSAICLLTASEISRLKNLPELEAALQLKLDRLLVNNE